MPTANGEANDMNYSQLQIVNSSAALVPLL